MVETYIVYAPTIVAALVALAAAIGIAVVAIRGRDDGGWDIDIKG